MYVSSFLLVWWAKDLLWLANSPHLHVQYMFFCSFVVSESVALNKKLSFVNDHQNCIVEQLRTELEVKSELLVQAKVKVEVIILYMFIIYC